MTIHLHQAQFVMVKPVNLFGSILVFLLIATGCSSSGRSTMPVEPEVTVSRAELERAVSATETFDTTPYAEEPPVVEEVLEHQVPATLLTGEASLGASAQGGYRIQVQFARDKASADATVERVIEWWSLMKGRYNDTMLLTAWLRFKTFIGNLTFAFGLEIMAPRKKQRKC